MTTKQAECQNKFGEWIKYTGSDEQITEMTTAEHGYILRLHADDEHSKPAESRICKLSYYKCWEKGISHYLICNPHPLVDMIIRQAQTRQPVFMRIGSAEYAPTTTPDWNIPGAEYSFAPFDDIVPTENVNEYTNS